MKKLVDLGIDADLFLTQGKDKPEFFHPGVLDKHLEEYLKVKEKVSTLSNTGLKNQLEVNSMTEFKELLHNFEVQQSELLVTTGLKAKTAAREAAKQERLQREMQKLEKETLFLHKNAKLLERIEVKDPVGSYYETVPVKPGFDFFNCLIRAPRRSLEKLALNVPNSLYFKDKIFHLYTAADGCLRCSDEISYFGYYRQLSAARKKGSEAFDKVAAVVRMRGESYSDVRKQVLDWTMLETKVNNHDLNPMSMMQQYLRCPGARPAVVRLFYFSFGNDSKANYALFINSLALDYPSISVNEQLNRCVVDTKQPQYLEVFRQSGGALRPFEAEALKVVQFLNAAYNLRISEIVLDFIKDEHGTIWLSGCKRILFDKASLIGALKPKKMPWEDVSVDEDSKTLEDNKERFKSCGED
jgi:hypothetical protein